MVNERRTKGHRKRETGTGTGISFTGMAAWPLSGLPLRLTVSSTQAFTAADEAPQPLR